MSDPTISCHDDANVSFLAGQVLNKVIGVERVAAAAGKRGHSKQKGPFFLVQVLTGIPSRFVLCRQSRIVKMIELWYQLD